MLAVITGHRCKLVENPRFLRPQTTPVSLRDRRHQLIAPRHAQQPHRNHPRRPPAGSKSDEAITQLPAAFLARKCAFGEWGKIFPDQAMTLAVIDRLVHHASIFEMNVESYRRRTALERKRGFS